MRVVAGEYGGRRLQVPKGSAIRPTSDKVRGAMFNILRGLGAVDGARVFDAFCGSGALGIEALSQGAAHCVFQDKSKESLMLARSNVDAFDAVDRASFVLRSALDLSFNKNEDDAFDLVFLDPPYRKNIIPQAIEVIIKNNWIRSGSIMVLEAERDFEFLESLPFHILQEKRYGDTKVIFLRYERTA